MASSSGRSSTPDGRRASSPEAAAAADEPVVLISAGDAQAAQIFGFLKEGDVNGLKKLDKKLKTKNGSSLLEAVGKVAADRLLHLAARWVQYEACKYLITDLKLDVDRSGEHGDLVVEHKIQDRERGRTPMISAIDGLDSASTSQKKKKCEKIVQLLLRRGASPNKAKTDGFALIHAATMKDSLDIIKLLLASGAKLNAVCQDGTVLHVAVQSGTSIAVVKLLLDQGIDPNIANISGYTALHLAAREDSLDIIKLLLASGAKLNAVCQDGTVLHVAVQSARSIAVIKLLLDQGVDPNIPNISGYTALHLAAIEDKYDVAKLLLAKGADVDAACEEGTALHIAAGRGNLKVLILLIHHDASANISDVSGRKAVEIAAFKEYRDCVEALFPVTSPITKYLDWSIDALIRSAKNVKVSVAVEYKIMSIPGVEQIR